MYELKKNWKGTDEWICWDRALVLWKKNLPGPGLTKVEGHWASELTAAVQDAYWQEVLQCRIWTLQPRLDRLKWYIERTEEGAPLNGTKTYWPTRCWSIELVTSVYGGPTDRYEHRNKLQLKARLFLQIQTNDVQNNMAVFRRGDTPLWLADLQTFQTNRVTSAVRCLVWQLAVSTSCRLFV